MSLMALLPSMTRSMVRPQQIVDADAAYVVMRRDIGAQLL